MEDHKDYYKILELGKDAEPEEIKKAYRKMAKQWHPDVNKDKDTTERFKEIVEAYSVLINPEKKKKYDSIGEEKFRRRYSFEERVKDTDFSEFNDMYGGNAENAFEQMFGFRSAKSQERSHQGLDLEAVVNISLKEAFFGTSKDISYRRLVQCASCDGIGAPPDKIYGCSDCKGEGYQQHLRTTPMGKQFFYSKCPSCGGAGRVASEPCRNCGATGAIEQAINDKVKIPPGVQTGTRLRKRGLGSGSRLGDPGDLYIVINMLPDKNYAREGNNLIVEKRVSMIEAALGTKIDIETIDGKKIRLTIPQGAQTNDLYKISGYGMPCLKENKRGDLYAKLYVETPRNLTEEERKILHELAKKKKK